MAAERYVNIATRIVGLGVLFLLGELTVVTALLVTALAPIVAGIVYWRLFLPPPAQVDADEAEPPVGGTLRLIVSYGNRVWLNDEEFARQWVTSRHTGRGLARRALSYELRQRGVADEVVREAVDEVSTEDELAAARELVRKRAPSMRADDDLTMFVYSAEPDSPDQEALDFLASWAATRDTAEVRHSPTA